MDRDNRDKSLDMTLGQIEKQFGKGAIMRLGERGNVGVESISTGALALDLALGIGGLPRGRIVEIFGPESSGKSTLATHVVAEAQRNGGVCAYIDAEHAMDPVYAAAIGVNVDELLISQPDTGEQALEIADMLIRSGALDVLVIDSVAALVPRAEIEGEMGDTHMGLQARLMSQALRKLTGNLNKSRTIAIFINQLREKIGVMFGCFSYGSRVTLADGTQEKIGKIVNQRMPVEVLSYDPELPEGSCRSASSTGSTTGRPTSSCSSRWRSPEATAARSSAARANHLIRTPAGWREAQELVGRRSGARSGSALTSPTSSGRSILGGLMGDGALSPTRSVTERDSAADTARSRPSTATGRRRCSRTSRVSRSTNDKGAVFHDVQPLPELAELRRGGLRRRQEGLQPRLPEAADAAVARDLVHGRRHRSRCGPRGSRSARATGAVGPRSASRRWRRPRASVSRTTSPTLGHPAQADRRVAARQCCPVPEGRDREAARAHRAVRPSLDGVQAAPEYRGRFAVEPVFTPMRHELVPMPITRIGIKPPTRSMHRFDIEVEGTHNYFVDGVMVHNSPETTPGGRALKFYSSVRLDIRRIEAIKDGTEVIGNRTRVKVVKNKVLGPVPPGRVRHHVRQGDQHARARCSTSVWISGS